MTPVIAFVSAIGAFPIGATVPGVIFGGGRDARLGRRAGEAAAMAIR